MGLERFVRFYRVREGYWFAPKMFGFGATPVTWQGWALTLAGAALLALDFTQVRDDLAKIVFAIVLFLVFTAIAIAKTDGGWRWRWGPGDR